MSAGQISGLIILSLLVCDAATAASRESVDKIQRSDAERSTSISEKRASTSRTTRELPKEAIGPVGAALPPGARRIPPQAFANLRNQRRLTLTSPTLTAEGMAVAARSRKALQDRLGRQLRARSDVHARVVRRPAVDGRRLRQLKDGSYRLQRRGQRPVRLENEAFLAAAVSESLQALQDPAVAARTYDGLRSRVAASVPDRAKRGAILSRLAPRGSGMRNLRQMESATNTLITRYLNYIATQEAESEPEEAALPPPPEGYVGTCASEEGAGSGGDLFVSPACGFSDIGLYQNAHWPLKYRTTCVKDQGGRGACVAFAMTAAVEAIVARDEDRWVNLSEQQLYYHEKNQWFSVPPNFGDGLITPLSVAHQMVGNYRFAFESAWDYNPSPEREEVVNPPLEFRYENSCVNYDGTHCSDTNHQGELVCATQCMGAGPASYCWESCAYTSWVGGNAQFRITSVNPIFNILNPQAGTDAARAFLATGVPVVASLSVVDSFDHVSDDGYVPYVAGSEAVRGGHAVLLTGYVPNAQVPPDAPPGAGGGYFIAKNSWGCDRGDGGYYYLPLDWVIKNVMSMTVIEGVEV